ncbi:uncharacterized protein LOC117180199 [Belonocnema kinseyi]|uniref:uncharacterized protein LOC117180199 n=1 Tax=Belonocnema kinseyi TaxID=2817044 RepID=UPI00143CD1A2|nr:uncharacterized protein LOC117180199 [Belonocnema kinseyi]
MLHIQAPAMDAEDSSPVNSADEEDLLASDVEMEDQIQEQPGSSRVSSTLPQNCNKHQQNKYLMFQQYVQYEPGNHFLQAIPELRNGGGFVRNAETDANQIKDAINVNVQKHSYEDPPGEILNVANGSRRPHNKSAGGWIRYRNSVSQKNRNRRLIAFINAQVDKEDRQLPEDQHTDLPTIRNFTNDSRNQPKNKPGGYFQHNELTREKSRDQRFIALINAQLDNEDRQKREGRGGERRVQIDYERIKDFLRAGARGDDGRRDGGHTDDWLRDGGRTEGGLRHEGRTYGGRRDGKRAGDWIRDRCRTDGRLRDRGRTDGRLWDGRRTYDWLRNGGQTASKLRDGGRTDGRLRNGGRTDGSLRDGGRTGGASKEWRPYRW